MRDPAAIHTGGLGFTLKDAHADYATLADFPIPGIVGRLAKALDTEIIYRDNATTWVAWVTPGGGGGSAGGPPTDWVDWFYSAGGLAQSTLHHVVWDDSTSSGLEHGSAISLNGSGDAQVTEDGWYTLHGYIDASTSSAGPWTQFEIRVVVNRSFVIGGDAENAASLYDSDYGTSTSGAFSLRPFHWTGYLLAGDTVVTEAVYTAFGANTWQIDSAVFQMEKLPMGGAGNAASPIVRKFTFAFDTANILTGATVYTPTVGDLLLDAWFEIDTAWDGTTPMADFGSFQAGDSHFGYFAQTSAAVDMTNPDLATSPVGLLGGASAAQQSLAELITGGGAGRVVPGKWTAANALKVCVSQDGKDNGASPGSSQGAATLYLVTCSPA